MQRVLTLNLNYYGDKHGPWDTRKKLIANVLKKHAPDVVLLQAVAWRKEEAASGDQAMELSRALDGFTEHYFQEAQTVQDNIAQGSAIISRTPIDNRSHLQLSRKPDTDDSNDRVLLKGSFATSEGRIDIYNGHFSWVHEQAVSNIEEAVRLILAGNDLAILGGDLNTPPNSKAFSLLRENGFTDAWAVVHGNEAGYTFESDNPTSRIDYFWVSPSLAPRIQDIAVVYPPPDSNARLSDHHGLLLTLR